MVWFQAQSCGLVNTKGPPNMLSDDPGWGSSLVSPKPKNGQR